MSSCTCVKWRNSHQSMHALFGFEVAVSIFAFYDESHALDTRLVAVKFVYDVDLVSLTLGVPRIHSKEHARPILRLGSARTRVQSEYCVVGVVLAFE